MLNPSQMQYVGIYYEHEIYHGHCAPSIDLEAWDLIVDAFEHEDNIPWDDSVPRRFARHIGGDIAIGYTVEEAETRELENDVEDLTSRSFGWLPEALQEYLDEYFHDGLDTQDLPSHHAGWMELIEEWVYSEGHKHGYGKIKCPVCGEEVS